MANVTKPIALDETLQAVNETLGEIKEAILPSNTYIPKVASPTAGNLPSLKADGTIEDSGVAKADVANTTNVVNSITPQEYSTSTSYAVGTLCMHNGYMYQCNTATSGTWNPAYWTQVRIGNMAALSYTVVSTF